MRNLFLPPVLACLAAGTAMSQRPAPVVPWKSSSLSAAALASQADAAMASLKGIEAQIGTRVIYEGTGQDRGWIHIKDSRHFHAQAPNFHYPSKSLIVLEKKKIRDEAFSGMNYVSDGKTVQYAGKLTGRVQVPAGQFKFDQSKKVADWVTGLPRYILGGVRGEKPLSLLVAKAKKPGSGFYVKVSERVVQYGKYNLPQYQLLVERDSAHAKKQGPIHIEMTFDGMRKLPVSAKVSALESGQKPVTMGWVPIWKPKTFPAKEFAVPKLH